jgi:hypothetical protein
MGKEVGMRKFRYIVPVIVALICTLYIFMSIQRSKSQIILMIDDAGSKGEPIVIGNSFMGNSFMVSLDHDPVDLNTKSFIFAGMMPFVSDGGVVTFIDTLNLLDNPTTTIRKIMLPKITIEKPPIIKTTPDIEFFIPISLTQDPKNVELDRDGYKILNLPDLTITTGQLQSPPPWMDEEHKSHSLSVISDNGKIIISRVYSIVNSSDELWSYNIETGEWREIDEGLESGSLSVNPDGSIIGFEFPHTIPPKTQFINVADGSVIHEVFQANHSIIGDRWIALYEINGQGIILIDMQNNWAERRIAIPRTATDDYTIWIPPPGGYDEMMSIREAESNSADSQ